MLNKINKYLDLQQAIEDENIRYCSIKNPSMVEINKHHIELDKINSEIVLMIDDFTKDELSYIEQYHKHQQKLKDAVASSKPSATLLKNIQSMGIPLQDNTFITI